MLCLLSAEIYKLRKSKSLYICMLSVALFIGLMYIMFVSMESMSEGEDENAAGEVTVYQGTGDEGSLLEGLDVSDVLEQTYSGDLMPCVLSIFVSIFVIGEFAGGMVKNIVGKGWARAEIYFSKLLTVSLGTAIIVLAGAAAVVLGGLVFLGKEGFSADFFKNAASFTGLQILLEIALSSLFMLAGECTRNYAAGISLGIGISVFPYLLFEGLDLLLEKSGFSLSQYWLVSRSATCPMGGIIAGYAWETALVCAVWFIAAAGLGVWHFYRADIK